MDISRHECVKCEGYCDTCDFANKTNCITCPLGFFFNETTYKCDVCYEKCETCTGRSFL